MAILRNRKTGVDLSYFDSLGRLVIPGSGLLLDIPHLVTGGPPGESIKGDKGDPGESIKGDKGDPGESIVGPPGPPGPARGRVGHFATSTLGHYSVTGVGFRPVVLEFFVSKNDGLSTWFCECHGFADNAGNQNASGWTGNYSNTFRGDMKVDRCLYAFNAAGALQVNATLVSMDADGFTLNFTNFNPAYTVRWKAQ